MTRLPEFRDIEAAAERLRGLATVTPLLENADLDARTGGRILLKAETLQRTGSFKFRGAYNRLSLIPEAERPRGVIAYSSGNHAQGVSAAAQLLGIEATILMPSDAPKVKVANTKRYGAKVIHFDRFTESREELAEKLQAETGAVLINPFDDPDLIAGQGTCGLEMAQQMQAAGLTPDAVLICVGGGALCAGSAIAIKQSWPDCPVYSVEPADFDDTARSLKSGERERNDPAARSICDALLSPMPGKMTFELNRKLLAGGFGVTDDEVRRAMAYAFNTLKLVVEPGGAVCLAAVLEGKLPTEGRTVALTLSGGSVDPERLAEALEANPAA